MYIEKEENLLRKVAANKAKLKSVEEKINNLNLEKQTLKRKIQNQENALYNIQVKAAEERAKTTEQLARDFQE